jgi:hypothetical protein
MKKTFLNWLPFAIVSTILFITIYTVAQQSIRQNANDPQIQLAQDYSNALEKGTGPALIANPTSFDISKTLDNFVIIVDSSNNIIASDAQIGSSQPVPPKGVFDYAGKHDDNRLTWQPQNGVRLAIVVKKYEYNGTTGYIVVGRNMQEVEKREDSIEKLVCAALFSTLVLSWFTIYLTKKIKV